MAKTKAALYYSRLEEDKVKCLLCPHHCVIQREKSGVCRVRHNREGELTTKNYGQVAAIHLDPIEKKPLYHFHPGKQIVSVGTYGCNFDCSFCQNWHLARGDGGGGILEPEELINLLERQFAHCRDNVGIAFTYNEPLVWYEYVLETSRLAQQKGLKVVLVTNGFLNPDPFQALLRFVDALNIDLKSFRDDYYRRYCCGSLKPVLENITAAVGRCHVEITTLVVTGLNDSREELAELTGWLGELNENIPLHLSRYFPNYKLERQPTPVNKMLEAAEIARQYLKYVYLGNVPQLGEANNTYCPRCGLELVTRAGYQVKITGLVPGGKGQNGEENTATGSEQSPEISCCKECGAKIPIVLEKS